MALNGCGRTRDTQSMAFFRCPGIRRVVLRRRDDECVAGLQPSLEFAGPGRQTVAGLEVLVVRRAVEIPHRRQIHNGAKPVEDGVSLVRQSRVQRV